MRIQLPIADELLKCQIQSVTKKHLNMRFPLVSFAKPALALWWFKEYKKYLFSVFDKTKHELSKTIESTIPRIHL